MNKKIIRILCFIMILCLAGCGSISASTPNRDELVTNRAIVTKVYDKSVLVKVEGGTIFDVPASWLEGKAEPKEGLILEITSTNMILETYPAMYAEIKSVEVVGFEEPAENNLTSALGEDGTLPREGSLCGFKFQLGGNEDYDTEFKYRGYYRYEHDARAPWVLDICSGEHSTGGYGIRIVNIEADEEGNLYVTVEEKAPKPEDVVTEAFTYPKTTLLIFEETKMPGSVTVKNTGGTELAFLGSLPPAAGSEAEGYAKQDQQAWEKVVIAPPEGAYCNISLCLPKGWKWSCSQSEDVPVSCIDLGIYPEAEGDAAGCIDVKYAEGFGLCGTGLESVETTFNGHAASKGTYDGHPYWDFIMLRDDYKDCSIWNYAGDTWYDKYKEELEAILATVEFTLTDGAPKKSRESKDLGEMYAKEPSKGDVVTMDDGIKYVRNQLLISAKMDCTKDKIENLGSAYGFEIVGYIELTQDYQIEFTRDMEEADLLKMINYLEEEDFISMVTLNYAVETAYD